MSTYQNETSALAKLCARNGSAWDGISPEYAARMRLRVGLGSLLRGRPLVLDLQLTRPRLLLEADPAGGPGNWIFGKRGRPADVRRLWVDDGLVRFVDTRQRSDLQVRIASQPHRNREDAHRGMPCGDQPRIDLAQ